MKIGQRNQVKAYLIDAHFNKLQEAKKITGKSLSTLIGESITAKDFI
jgi:hypothetical protein